MGGRPKFLATSPLDPIMTSIAIAIYGGLLLTIPVASYQLYAFLIPAVSAEHHRSLRPLVAMVPALFIAGAVFGWYLVVPPSLGFLLNFNSGSFTIAAPREGLHPVRRPDHPGHGHRLRAARGDARSSPGCAWSHPR